MPDDRRVETRGGAVTFRVLAAGRGAPLVYFHSYYERSAWSPFLDLLARSFSVYAPCHPGVPGSTGIETLDDLLDLTLAYDELLGALSLERAHLVGHSFGGMAAAEIAAVFPGRARSLTLVSPLGLWRDDAPSADILILPADELAAVLWRDPASGVAREWAAASGDQEDIAAQVESLQRRSSMAKFVWPIPDKGLHRRLPRIAATKGGRATFVQGDVSRWDDVDRGIAASVRELGPLGIMVNAAGVLDGYASAEEIAPALWERVIGINLTGTFFGSKRALAEMLPRARGRIINIASVAGLVGSGGGAAYTPSKHGLVGLARQLAITYAARGVTVNAICPGAIQTGLRVNSTRILGADAPVMGGVGGDEAAVRAITPAGRRGTLEEVAAAACYLASAEADYVTGHTLVIDGGWTAR